MTSLPILSNNTRIYWRWPIAFALVVGLMFLADNAWRFKPLLFTLAGREAPFHEVSTGLTLVALVFFAMFLRRYSRADRAFSMVIIGLFLSVAISYAFGSVTLYHQPLDRVFRTCFWFAGITIYYILTWLVGTRYQRVFRWLILYGFFAMLFASVAAFYRPFYDLFKAPELVRYGLNRVIFSENAAMLACCFFIAAVALRRTRLMERFAGKPIISIIGLVVSSAYFLFVDITRQRIIALFIVICIIAIASFVSKRFKLQFGALVIFGTMMFVLLSSSYIQNIVGSFSGTSARASESDRLSVEYRLAGVEFYFNEFLRSSGIGIGRVSISEDVEQSDVSYAISNNMRVADLGILGAVFQYGVLGLIVYLYLLYIAAVRLTRVYANGDEIARVIALTFILYFTIEIITANYIFFWPHFTFFYGVLLYCLDQLSRPEVRTGRRRSAVRFSLGRQYASSSPLPRPTANGLPSISPESHEPRTAR